MTRTYQEERRLVGAVLLKAGYSHVYVAQACGVSNGSVYHWAKLLREGGEPALLSKPREPSNADAKSRRRITPDRASMEERRLTGGHLLRKGYTQGYVARYCGVSRTTTSRWARLLASGGADALQGRPAPGRPRRLNPKQVGELQQQHPTWTTQRLAEEVRTQYGVSYHRDHVGRLVKQGATP